MVQWHIHDCMGHRMCLCVCGSNGNSQHRAGCVAKLGGVTCNTRPVAMHNTVFGLEIGYC